MQIWGPGLEANDLAKDAIWEVEEFLKGTFPFDYVKDHSLDKIFEIASKFDTENCKYGTLGVAEWLTGWCCRVVQYRVVHEALEFELKDEQLERFPDKEERKEVLKLFAKRILDDLTPDEEEKVRESNEGLFTRMLKAYRK